MADNVNRYLELILKYYRKQHKSKESSRCRHDGECLRKTDSRIHPTVAGTDVQSCPCHRGYFIPDENDPTDIAEAERYMSMMRGQAMERLQTVKAIEHWLEKNRKPVQMNMDAYIRKG